MNTLRKWSLTTLCLVAYSLFATTATGRECKAGAKDASDEPARLLIINWEGMTEDTPYIEYNTDKVFVSLESYFTLIDRKEYDAKSVVKRIKELEGEDIHLKSVELVKANDAICGDECFDRWHIVYELESGEDTELCTDVYIQHATGEYRAHIIASAADAQACASEIERIRDSVSLPILPEINTEGMEALNDLQTEYSSGDVYISICPLTLFQGDQWHFNQAKISSFLHQTVGTDELGGISELVITEAPEDIKTLVGFQAWFAHYVWGENEDTSNCMDLFYLNDKNNFWIRMIADGDADPVDFHKMYLQLLTPSDDEANQQ